MHRPLLLVIAALTLLISGRICRDRDGIRESHLPYGRFTPDQILDKSGPICACIYPEAGPLSLDATPLTAWSGGMRCHMWLVDAYDVFYQHKVHLLWNADSGVLESATTSYPLNSLSSGDHPMQARDAMAITGSWLTMLGMSDAAAAWRPDGGGHDTSGVWRYEWTSGTRAYAISVDAETGNLINALEIRSAVHQGKLVCCSTRELAAGNRIRY